MTSNAVDTDRHRRDTELSMCGIARYLWRNRLPDRQLSISRVGANSVPDLDVRNRSSKKRWRSVGIGVLDTDAHDGRICVLSGFHHIADNVEAGRSYRRPDRAVMRLEACAVVIPFLDKVRLHYGGGLEVEAFLCSLHHKQQQQCW
jgi:hypothetical protein